MSKSLALVRFPDGEIFCACEFSNGVLSKQIISEKRLRAEYKSFLDWLDEVKDIVIFGEKPTDIETVELISGNLLWKGTASKSALCIVDGIFGNDDDLFYEEYDGKILETYPEWLPRWYIDNDY